MPTIQMSPEEVKRVNEHFNREFPAACKEIIPAKFRDIRPTQLQPSKESRLPLDEQAKLYKEINEKWNEGWAFFSPTGYGKTTVSWALFKYALRENLARAIYFGKDEFIRRGPMDSPRVRYWTPCYVWHVNVPEWLAQIQASWNEENRVAPPALSLDKPKKAEQNGFRPRVFLGEIDKIKAGSEWSSHLLFNLVNAIEESKGQLVLDTNLSKHQFMQQFGEPFANRIKRMCNMREWGF